jgi:ABC-type antimicrobial peptide transport system permease subunit
MAYSISTRQREIGIRMAIGAQRATVLSMMLRKGAALAGAGTILGLLLGLVTGRLMLAVFPSQTVSAAVYLMVVPAVFAVTMLAAFLPARRATQVDPVTALRQE